MLLGILSDSHDNAASMKAGIDLLRQRGAAYVIHCGDVVSAHMLDYLAGIPAAFVFGNCDWDRAALQRYAEQVGVQCFGKAGQVELAGRRIAFTHGDDPKLRQRILADDRPDYLLSGHTHVRADVRHGPTRLINPGALQRATEKTVALLDLAADTLEFLVVTTDPRR